MFPADIPRPLWRRRDGNPCEPTTGDRGDPAPASARRCRRSDDARALHPVRQPVCAPARKTSSTLTWHHLMLPACFCPWYSLRPATVLTIAPAAARPVLGRHCLPAGCRKNECKIGLARIDQRPACFPGKLSAGLYGRLQARRHYRGIFTEQLYRFNTRRYGAVQRLRRMPAHLSAQGDSHKSPSPRLRWTSRNIRLRTPIPVPGIHGLNGCEVIGPS